MELYEVNKSGICRLFASGRQKRHKSAPQFLQRFGDQAQISNSRGLVGAGIEQATLGIAAQMLSDRSNVVRRDDAINFFLSTPDHIANFSLIQERILEAGLYDLQHLPTCEATDQSRRSHVF
jgi:hypothetical protein